MTTQAPLTNATREDGIRLSRVGKRPVPMPKGVSATVKERSIEREKPVEREKPAIPQAPHVVPQAAVQPPSPQRSAPHEEPRAQPSEKKGNQPPGKDKDKDKDKDKKNGN